MFPYSPLLGSTADACSCQSTCYVGFHTFLREGGLLLRSSGSTVDLYTIAAKIITVLRRCRPIVLELI